MAKVSIVGIGPGAPEYITKRGRSLISCAGTLVGTQDHLDLFANKQKKILLKKNYSSIVEFIVKNKDKTSIAVMVSGDPGIFSFSKMITAKLLNHEYEIVPGVSMVQLLCARIGQVWDDMHIISLHGKGRRGLSQTVRRNPKVFIYSDHKNNPQQIAAYLFALGIKKRKVYVGENLSHKDEEITETTIAKLKDTRKEWKRLWTMLIKK